MSGLDKFCRRGRNVAGIKLFLIFDFFDYFLIIFLLFFMMFRSGTAAADCKK